MKMRLSLSQAQLLKLEIFLISFVVLIFILSATQSAYFSYLHIAAEGYGYVLGSIVSMSITGLGLTALLSLKLKEIYQSAREKKKIMDMLTPRVAAMEATSDGIMITDADGMITYANYALATLHGYGGAEDIIGRPWYILYTDIERREIEQGAFHELLSRWHWQGYAAGLRKDKKQYPQDVSITALEGNGKVWVVRDYTETKNYIDLAQKRLAAIEAAGDGIGIVDWHGNLTYMNKALQKLHAIEPEDRENYLGHYWGNLYTPKGRKDIRDHVFPYLTKHGSWKGDAPILKASGDVVHAEMSLTLLPDGGFIGTARDISDRIQAEQEKEELQKQFYQAQKMEAVGRLAGGIAHDFNNILASLSGYAEFLIEDLPEEERTHGYAEQIMKGVGQAQRLVEQILTFSRKRETEKDAVDLVQAVGETSEMLRVTMPGNITLALDVEREEAVIEGNATHIMQVLMNLCVNAIDAFEGKGGTLIVAIDEDKAENLVPLDMVGTIYAEDKEHQAVKLYQLDEGKTRLEIGKLAPDGDYICIRVEDNGCGIPAAVMEHIFDPFYTTKPVDQGTGLGLSSTHGIMLVHGGAIAVESQEGVGTRFCLYFPLAQCLQQGQSIQTENYEDADIHGRILVVDDDAQIRSMLEQTLTRMGHLAHSCEDGAEALDYLRDHPDEIDLVLSDFTMPRMNGEDLANEIAEDFPSMPVIILSGYSKRKLKALPSENSCIKSVLYKPVRKDILAEHIVTALQEKS